MLDDTNPPQNRFSNEVEKITIKKREEQQEKVTKNNIQAELGNQDRALIVTKKEKTLAAFGYISFLCILPLVLEPNSKFCKTHGKQSLVLTVLFFFVGILEIFSALLIARILFLILFILHIIIIIVGFIQASQGKLWKIPMIADAAEKLEI